MKTKLELVGIKIKDGVDPEALVDYMVSDGIQDQVNDSFGNLTYDIIFMNIRGVIRDKLCDNLGIERIGTTWPYPLYDHDGNEIKTNIS